MSVDQRVVVIGAGVAGLSVAAHLTELGCTEVVVLDSVHVGAGSSSLSVGMFTRSYSEQLDIELRAWSHDYLAHLERTEGLPLRRIGFLRLARDEAALARLSEGVRLQRSLGVDDSRILRPDQIRALFPDLLVDDLAGAMFLEEDGYLDGAVLCGVYQQLATRRGARVVGRSQVQSVERTSAGFVVRTGRGSYDADCVVNAAGPWANQVADLLDAPLGLIPQRHDAAVLRCARPPENIVPNVMDYVPGSAADGVYFRHEGERQLVAGIHSNDVHAGGADEPGQELRPASDFVDELAELLSVRLGYVDDVSVEATWSGLYPMSPDGLPLLGPTAQPGVYACAGLGGVGINLSPVAGRLVAESIVLGEFRAVSGSDRLRASRAVRSTGSPRRAGS